VVAGRDWGGCEVLGKVKVGRERGGDGAQEEGSFKPGTAKYGWGRTELNFLKD
jgi:hypothetical protein